MQTYDVLVVDDSVFMRKLITDFVSSHPDFRVVATAKNGREAVELVHKWKPHVVTMDIEMPEMNGLDALRMIMKEHPIPVIMLSSLTQQGASETIKALEWGAFDFVGKPSGSISLDLHKVKDILLEKLMIAVKANVKTMGATIPSSRISKPPETGISPLKPVLDKASTINKGTRFEDLVAIGTSTGGPRALHTVLSSLPGTFPAPIVIVQHMPPNFTKSLSQRLDSVSQIKVCEAEDGMKLESGTAYVAPGGFHMMVARNGSHSYRIHLSEEQPRGGHRPSVDMLFESLLPLKELKRHIVLMTGMGSDGAKGMHALRQSGAVTTIAESEETCIVYGMPRAAVELQCVTDILAQHRIAKKLTEAVFQHP